MPQAYYEPDKARLKNSSKLVIVEGKDDASLISCLLAELNADPTEVGIIDVNGAPNFPKQIELLLLSHAITSEEITNIAITYDADENPKNVYNRIKATFSDMSYTLPPLGVTANLSSSIRGGIFAFPNNGDAGDLEAFCLRTVENRKLTQLATDFLTSAVTEAKDNGKTLPGSTYKRTAQAYISAYPGELVRGAGLAFAKGYFDQQHEVVGELRKFLKTSLALA